ncbi:hypothetical protein C2W62_18495 [Candidatus Entotheonella serta]|nr:hypothetical protein C2W62_18495 [Candidatus Entotheonella serta]
MLLNDTEGALPMSANSERFDPIRAAFIDAIHTAFIDAALDQDWPRCDRLREQLGQIASISPILLSVSGLHEAACLRAACPTKSGTAFALAACGMKIDACIVSASASEQAGPGEASHDH